MILTSPSLQEQRYRLQQQLQVQRQRIDAQFGSIPYAPGHYPRSITMRFLSGGTGIVLLTQLALWRLESHYPGVVSVAQKLIRMFSRGVG